MSTYSHSAVAEAFRFPAGLLGRVCTESGPRRSLVLVSAGAAKRTVVANLALAIAGGGRRVIAVYAADGNPTALLVPGSATADGFAQVLSGQRATTHPVLPSTWNEAVTVLGFSPTTPERVRGAANSQAVDKPLAEAKASFDVILIDSPALLRVADATEIVDVSDVTIIVLSFLELIRDHLEMVSRLDLIESDVVGYLYKRAPRPSHSAGTGVMVSPVDPLVRRAWTPPSPSPACPRRVVRASGAVFCSGFGPLRRQHRGLT